MEDVLREVFCFSWVIVLVGAGINFKVVMEIRSLRRNSYSVLIVDRSGEIWGIRKVLKFDKRKLLFNVIFEF